MTKMVTVFIAGVLARLPVIPGDGQEASPDEAAILQFLWTQNIDARLRYFIKQNPHTTPDALLAEAKRLFTTYKLPPPHRLPDDPIEIEARVSAKALILQRLQAEGLPEPRNLDEHIDILLTHRPVLYDQAIARIEARFRTDHEALTRLFADSAQ